MRGLALHYHEDTNTRTMTVALAVKVKEDEAKKILGEEFHATAFGPMTDIDGEPIFRYKTLAPSLTCEIHRATIAGVGPVVCQPEVKSITPVRGEAAVIVDIRLPIKLEQPKLAGELAAKFGEVVDVSLQASQQQLPLGGAVVGIIKKRTGPWGNAKPVAVGG
jgi:hypothetical protein